MYLFYIIINTTKDKFNNCLRRLTIPAYAGIWVYFCLLRLRNGSFYSHISAESLPKTHPYPETFLEIHLNAATGKSKRQKDETIQNHEGVSFVFLKRFCRIVCTLVHVSRAQSGEKTKDIPEEAQTLSAFCFIELSLYKIYLIIALQHYLKACLFLLPKELHKACCSPHK